MPKRSVAAEVAMHRHFSRKAGPDRPKLRDPVRRFAFRCSIHLAGALLLLADFAHAQQPPQTLRGRYFGIRVVDEQTGRGVPLVELRTVNEIAFITDSAGWAAIDEPGLTNREVFFHVEGPGYEHAKDGFGFRGMRLRPAPGTTATVKVRRTNIAQRMYRVTGQGIFRDSELLGIPTPDGVPPLNAGVLGQDSVQAVPYRGGIFWLWGDTSLANYPLGNFKTTCAASPLPGPKTFRPADGVPLTYFADDDRPERVREMAPLDEPGVVWLSGLLNVRDPDGKPTLLAHFSRRASLEKQLEHGLMRLDDEAGIFKKIETLDLDETWRFPREYAVKVSEDGVDYFYFAAPFPVVRVRADRQSLVDPKQYEAFAFDAEAGEYAWQRRQGPTTQADETELLAAGKLPPERARYQIVDAQSGDAVHIHRASVNWNAFRKRWVLIGTEIGGRESALGEVWYAEAERPTGPWAKGVKIASHPQYSFYNPRHHLFFDEEEGRMIYFEGTYTRMFSGNPSPTPRYEYNQLMYRLDLSDERLKKAR